MLLKGFNTPDAEYYLDRISEIDPDDALKLERLIDVTRQLKKEGDSIFYTLPGLPLCWKCTVKHLGQAVGFASELEGYPERLICVVGELGHAYRECPDSELAEDIRSTYVRILETGCVPDFTPLMEKVYRGWLESLQDSK